MICSLYLTYTPIYGFISNVVYFVCFNVCPKVDILNVASNLCAYMQFYVQ